MIQTVLRDISKAASVLGVKAFIVGGFIRDTLLGQESFDVDITVSTRAIELAQQLKQHGELKIHERFGTAKLHYADKFEIDLVSMRKERYERPGALPIVEPGSLEDDLLRRDFSINTLACDASDFLAWSEERGSLDALKARLVDQHHGIRDLAYRSIRVLHAASFIDDPTRIFRACRYEARVRGTIEQQTKDLLDAALKQGCLGTISTDRIRNELRHIAHEEACPDIIRRLDELGVLKELKLGSERVFKLLERAYSEGRMASLSKEDRERFLLLLLMLDLSDTKRQEYVQRYGMSKKLGLELEQSLRGASKHQPSKSVQLIKELSRDASK